MRCVAAVLLGLTLAPLLRAEPAAKEIEVGTVAFVPIGDQKDVPERYRLQAHQFDYEMERKQDWPISGVEVFAVRFPSPVKSPSPENNVVHAEYYRPLTGHPNTGGLTPHRSPGPCVVVLDITGGDQKLSRLIARHLAQNGIGGLFVQMAYYGPRRAPGSNNRLLSTNFARTFDAIRQTVLDLRRAAAWMAARPEIDKNNLGIMGTSLGSFMAALTAEMEPRFRNVAVLLGGGGFIDGYYNHPQAAPFITLFEALGGSKDLATKFIAPVDPLTLAGNLKDRNLLIIAAKNDEIVPPRMAENLWKASGQQRIIWLNAGHYSAVLYLITGLTQVVEHFKAKA